MPSPPSISSPPSPPLMHVVAFHAPQQVGLIVPDELVVIPRAGQVLDIDQRVALGVAARIPAADQHEGCERDVHALLRAVVGGDISAVAAIERVGADAAVEVVVVVAAVELVVAVLAPQEVVVVAAVELVLAPAALEPVVAVAAEEFVSAVVAEEVVAAAKAVNRVVPVAAIDLVVARGDAVGCIENIRVRRSSDVGHGPTLSWSRLSARVFARAAVLPVGARVPAVTVSTAVPWLRDGPCGFPPCVHKHVNAIARAVAAGGMVHRTGTTPRSRTCRRR